MSHITLPEVYQKVFKGDSMETFIGVFTGETFYDAHKGQGTDEDWWFFPKPRYSLPITTPSFSTNKQTFWAFDNFFGTFVN